MRHAITKLSHIHFPATKVAMQNIIKMGENPENVFLSGCPSLDLLNDMDLTLNKNLLENIEGLD